MARNPVESSGGFDFFLKKIVVLQTATSPVQLFTKVKYKGLD
jgi:hypothetical protein